ncbi:MAG: NAD-binding protein [Spirochaeta sp.]|nr:NAD-binding protein [Spirochaeta sp.]
MRVWILGAGTLGVLVADHFVRELHDVVLIERDHAAAGEALRKVDCNVEICDGTDLAALRRLSIDRADCFVAVTGSDEVNMVVCGLVAHAFRTPVKIARVRNSHYAMGISGDPELFGIDHVLTPEIETAASILRSLEYGPIGQVAALQRTSYSLREVLVSAAGGLEGASLAEVRRSCSQPFIAPMLTRDREYIIVSGSTRLRRNDTLYVFSTAEAHQELLVRDGGKPLEQRGRILILGGSLIGVTLAQSLWNHSGDKASKDGMISRLMQQLKRQVSGHMTIIEPSEALCEHISHMVPGAEIINADIRDEHKFKAEDYQRHDMAIAVGTNQEANIVGALHAKVKGVPRVAAVLYQDGYARIARSLGVDLPVSLRSCTVSAIASHLRGDAVKALYSIAGTSISIVEVVLAERSAFNGVPLSRAALPGQTLILSITRDSTVIIPNGDELLIAGDIVVALTPRRYEATLIHLIRATRQMSRAAR